MVHALILFFCLQTVPVQAATDLPHFEVASVKLNTTANQPLADIASGHITVHNLPLQRLVQEAWNVRPEQIEGAPAWMKDDHYDLAAKAAHDSSIAEVRRMLQALLIDRFHMTVHMGQAEHSAFVLEVGKNGAKLGPAEAETPERMAREGCQPVETAPGSGERAIRCTLSMDRLALSLPLLAPGYFSHTTGNKTDLAGVYEFELRYIGAGQQGTMPGPSMFDALAKLGLDASDRKVMLPTLVIDKIDRTPSGD